MWKDFKTFVMRGNVLDLAVAVVIGGAFGKIVASLVADIIMPLIGLLMGGVSFAHLQFSYGDAVIKYGTFLQSVLDFLIVAFSIFVFIRLISSFKKKEAAAPAAKPAPTKEQELLTEIRDLLKKKK